MTSDQSDSHDHHASDAVAPAGAPGWKATLAGLVVVAAVLGGIGAATAAVANNDDHGDKHGEEYGDEEKHDDDDH